MERNNVPVAPLVREGVVVLLQAQECVFSAVVLTLLCPQLSEEAVVSFSRISELEPNFLQSMQGALQLPVLSSGSVGGMNLGQWPNWDLLPLQMNLIL